MNQHTHVEPFASCRSRVEVRLEAVLWFAFLVIPLVVGLMWGTYFDDKAYVVFRCARDLAAGRGIAYHLSAGSALGAGAGCQALLRAPLYTLALALLARWGIPLPQAGLVLSAVGWGVTAVGMYGAGRGMRRLVAALVAAALVGLSPIVVTGLGTEVSWAVAWAWLAIGASLRKRWDVQACALGLMLGTCLEGSTLALAALLWALEWIERRRFPVWSGLVLAVGVMGWGGIAVVQQGVFPPLVGGDRSLVIGQWGLEVGQLVGESEFYWLFLPLCLCGVVGLLSEAREAVWGGILWGAWVVASTLGGGTTVGSMLFTQGLFLAGLGLEMGIGWLERCDVVRLDWRTLAIGLAVVVGLPLGVAESSSLLERYRFRPVVRQELEQQTGDWLRVHSEAGATVLGTERVGYLADRSVLAWDGGEDDPGKLEALLRPLAENPPEYCVSFRSLAWDRLVRTDWFQDRYAPLQIFESPYDAASPFMVWGYRLRAFDREDHEPSPLNVRLPGGVVWIGYSYWPDRIQPGDPMHVTLFLQPTQPITESFRIVVRLISPIDGVSWAQHEATIPRSTLVNSRSTGQVIVEQFVLTTTNDIPVAAYHLDVSVSALGSEGSLSIYRRSSTAALDRITLGDVIVPWQGDVDMARPVGADFGNQVSLLGFEAADSVMPGTELEVRLYWEALQPPEDDYVVFVHLLDATGQLVASHDGSPVDGRYPATTWLPGEVVPDVHRVVLDPQVPVGTYWLQVGMYRWPSMERLPIWDSHGVEQAGRVIALHSVEVH